jgi:hypothetical protein
MSCGRESSARYEWVVTGAGRVWGGDWGVRLNPRDGRPAFGEPYLLLSAHAVD